MDANKIIADAKRRLVAMAINPPFVYRDTPNDLIEREARRLTTFVGFMQPEIKRAELSLGLQFPLVFRAFLLEMAQAPGELFRGQDLATIEDFGQFRANAEALMATTVPILRLQPDAVVFLFHQGYTFLFMECCGGFDSPVQQFTEMDHEPKVVNATFAGWLDAELELMESNHRKEREMGGFYRTLHAGGGGTDHYPAVASGEGLIN